MYYKVQVATDSSFQYVVWSSLVTDGSLNIVLKNLDYYTRYYWRVKSIEEMYGNESAWSDYCTFVTKGADAIFEHTTTSIYYLSMHNVAVEEGIKCRDIGMDLNDLRIDKNYPVAADGAKHLLSMDLEDLLNRN